MTGRSSQKPWSAEPLLCPGFSGSPPRTEQRRLKMWRQERAHKMVFGSLSSVDGA
jgi:hypothetical protein